MMLATLIGFAVLTSPVEDFFPLVPGTTWTYEDADGRQLQQAVGTPIDIGNGHMASPMTKTSGNQNLGTDLLRIDGDTVQMVGFLDKTKKDSPLNIFPNPQPLLRITDKKSEWNYTDQVFTENGPIVVQIACNASKGPKRQLLGKEVETVVAHSILKFGSGQFAREVRRDMIYGKQIGMIETTEATKIQGKTVKKVLKLVKFEPAEG